MRVGIVGTGFVSEWFVSACRELDDIEAVAICSRDQARATSFAEAQRLPRAYAQVSAMANDRLIDAIYVASPIGAHPGQVRTALAHGKHVLCEKTMGVDLAETESLMDAAATASLVLLEAVRTCHDPALHVVAAGLPKLGRVRHASLEKCQYSSRYDAFRRGEVLTAFEPRLGSSAIADLGVYSLHPAVQLFGAPVRVSGEQVYLTNGFDASGVVLLGYGSMTVTCRYSKVTSSVLPSVIEGEGATMTIDSLAEPACVRVHHRDGSVEDLLSGPPRSPASTMKHEISAFARMVRGGRVDPAAQERSREVMRIMDEVRSQAGAPRGARGRARVSPRSA